VTSLNESQSFPISQHQYFGAPLSWVVDYKYPHDIKCPLGIFHPKSSIASMNNPALWPYCSPSYLQLGVEWFYLVPLLFLAHTCIRLMISKCMWQFICNTMQIFELKIQLI